MNDPNNAPRVYQINVSPTGGVPKRPVETTTIHATGVTGDLQRHSKIHGGPLRAVCLYSIERILALQAEGHPILPGSTGENLTLQGIDWPSVAPGDRFIVNDIELEVTRFTTPCKQITASFADGNSMRIGQDRYPGWSRVYARVLRPGTVRIGDRVTWQRDVGLFPNP